MLDCSCYRKSLPTRHPHFLRDKCVCKPPINTVDTVHTVVLIESSPAGIRVVSNAGGVNPLACASAIQEAAKKAGVDIKVAVVTGDDLMPNVRFSLCEAVITIHVHKGAHFSL